MKRLILVSVLALAVICLMSDLTLAQDINFTGDWKFNADKSKMAQRPGRGDRGGPPGGRRGGGFRMNNDRKIEHNGINLKVITTRPSFEGGDITIESKYTTDGKECKNAGFRDSETISTCKFEKNVLIIDSVTEMQMRDRDITMKVKEEYSLSNDGKVLTIKQTRSGFRGEDMVSTLVFDKK